MASTLNPYLTFAGNARSAMEFYQSVFGGELSVMTFGDYGTEGEGADGIMHANLSTPSGFTLMGADTPPGESYQPGQNISISISGDEGDAMRGYWEKLSEGGTVTVPLEKQMWGDEFGACTDRFGVPWMVNIGTAA
jgi:PhnB protein